MITRRTLLQQAGLAVTAAAAAGTTRLLLQREPLVSSAIAVPADFLGMHFHRWPYGNPLSPPPTYGYGAVRSHDYSGLGRGIAWSAIHTSEGTFDWTEMDRWVEVHSKARKTLGYTIYSTPAWLSTAPQHADLYGKAGAAAPPRTQAPLAAFVEALVERYNRDGQRRIHFVEIWNEPHFRQNFTGFWWGTATELALLGHTVATAVRKADAGVRILSPAFDEDVTGALRKADTTPAAASSSAMYQYLSAADGSGGTAGKGCDALAFHTYRVDLGTGDSGLSESIRLIHKLLGMLGLTLPVFCTECGFFPQSVFRRSPPAMQALMLKRTAALMAAERVQGLFFYSHDDDFIGNPAHHPELAAALDEVHTRLAGQTLLQITPNGDGSLRITTAKESFEW